MPVVSPGKPAAVLLFCLCFAAAADDDPPKAEAPQAAAQSEPAAEAPAEFQPPPGFRRKKHGDVFLYCRRETVLGSRFKAEKCYDEAGVEALMRAEREQNEILERIRNCGVGTCPAG